MNDFIGILEFDAEANPGARIIPLENGYVIVPDPDSDTREFIGPCAWTPFDVDGNLRDLEAEGFVHLGALE